MPRKPGKTVKAPSSRPRVATTADQRSEIASRLEALPENFLACRDPGLRHAWFLEKDFHVTKMSSVGKKIEALARVEQCGRCGTIKTERFIVTGAGIEKVGHTYAYPAQYQMPGVPRGVKPSTVIHQIAYRRAMEKVAKAQADERETSER